MQSWSVHPLGYRKWFALARTAADTHVNMADGSDQDFGQMKTDVNKIWLLTLVRLTVQFECFASGTHENETQKKTLPILFIFNWGLI